MVYLSAFVPDVGESGGSLIGAHPTPLALSTVVYAKRANSTAVEIEGAATRSMHSTQLKSQSQSKTLHIVRNCGSRHAPGVRASFRGASPLRQPN
jgi:hypothetical protein